MASKQSLNGQVTCARCCNCSCKTSEVGGREIPKSTRNGNPGISDDAEAKPERPKTARSNYSKPKRSKSTGRTLNGFGGLQSQDKYGNPRQLYSAQAEPADSEQSGVDTTASSSAKMNNFYSYGEPRLLDDIKQKETNFCVGRVISSGELLDYHRRNKDQMFYWNELISRAMEERERKHRRSSKLSDHKPEEKEEKPKKLDRVSRFFMNLTRRFENTQGHSGASKDGQGKL